ncbi:sex peptide receptor-related protein 2-like [Macrobrachium nipponense]|uniref:sex peptide receptor-related protein 2-like n=1 Tax=Macrobrachium nipponense TaxID=159736 RepID=UPI0030C8BFE1
MSDNNTIVCVTEERNEDLDDLYWVTFQVVFPFLIALGIICNAINLVVLTRRRMMSKIYRWLRVTTVSDMFLCFLLIPVCLANCGHFPIKSYTIAMYYSKFAWSISSSFQVFSFYLMVWFAYSRYVAVCCHEDLPRSMQCKVFRKRVMFTFLFVFTLQIPTMFFGEVCQTQNGEWLSKDGYRNVGDPLYEVYSWFREVCNRIIPPVLLTACNIKILLKLRNARSITECFAQGISRSRRNKERRLVLLLFWASAVFYIYQTPVTIYLLLLAKEWESDEEQRKIFNFGIASNIIQMIGNISNFTLYFLVNSHFRATFRHVFFRDAADDVDDSDKTAPSESQSKIQTNIIRIFQRKNNIVDSLSVSEIKANRVPKGNDLA